MAIFPGLGDFTPSGFGLVDVDELLDFIEGNKNEDNNKRPMSNDKKKAKKERQKQQRMEEIRKLHEKE